MKILGICFHNWVVEERVLLLHSTRVCRDCGKVESFGFDGWRKTRIVCKRCNGQGQILNKNYEIATCPQCHGTGD